MPAAELAPQYDESRAHVRVAVRYHRPALLQTEDLLAEARIFRQSFDLLQVKRRTEGSIVGKLDLLGDLVEFDELHQRIQIDPLVQILHLRLKLGVFQLPAMEIVADVV